MPGRKADPQPDPREEEVPIQEPTGSGTTVNANELPPNTNELPVDDREYTGPGTHAVTGERIDLPKNSVVYLGEYGMREITAEDWKKAGVQDQPTVRWERSGMGAMAVPREAFSEEAMRVIVQMQEFRVTGDEDAEDEGDEV